MIKFGSSVKITVTGRVGKDLELKYSAAGNAYCNYSVAHTQSKKKQDGSYEKETVWYNVVESGALAEKAAQFIKKGSMLSVTGEFWIESYRDKDNALKWKYEIRYPSEVFIFDNKEDKSASTANERTYEKTNEQPKQPATNSITSPDDYVSFWFMRDNHTFIRPKGTNFDEIINDFIAISKENPYGMVAPVRIYNNKKVQINSVDISAHVDGDGNVDLSEWIKKCLEHDCIRSYSCENETP